MPIRRPEGASAPADGGGLVAVDATSGAGGLRVDPDQFDAYYLAPQKCFASDGGLWVALLSPAALERIERSPPPVDGSRPSSTSRSPSTTPGSTRPTTRRRWPPSSCWPSSSTGCMANGGLEWTAGRCDRSAEILYTWAEQSGFARPFVESPSERSHVVGTIDFVDAIDAAAVAADPAGQRHRRHRALPQARPQPACGSPCSRPSSPTTSPRCAPASTTWWGRWPAEASTGWSAGSAARGVLDAVDLPGRDEGHHRPAAPRRPARSGGPARPGAALRTAAGRPRSRRSTPRRRPRPDVSQDRLHLGPDGLSMTRGPRVTSPYSAVSEMEYRMPAIPCSYMRSTMSFSSCRHSK